MDELCNRFANCSTSKSYDALSCDQMFDALPQVKCNFPKRRNPGRDCKNLLKPNAELLKRAKEIISIKPIKENSRPKKSNLFSELLNEGNEEKIKKMLNKEIKYANALFYLYTAIDMNIDVLNKLSNADEYYYLHQKIIKDKKTIIEGLNTVQNKVQNTVQDNQFITFIKTNSIKGQSAEGQSAEYSQSELFKKLKVEKESGGYYETGELWRLISKLQKLNNLMNEGVNEDDNDEEMSGGSIIWNIYKKYCKA